MFDSKFFSFGFLFDYFWGIWGGERGTKVLLSLLGVSRLVDKMYLGTGQAGSFWWIYLFSLSARGATSVPLGGRW